VFLSGIHFILYVNGSDIPLQNCVAVIGEVGFFISFAKKKRSKESCPGNLLNPSLTAAQRARVTALVLCSTAVTAQLEQGEWGAQL